MIRRYLPKDTEQLIHWYERYVSPFALIAGFLLDNFVFLDRIDSLQGLLYLASYMIIAAIAIAAIHLTESGRLKGRLIFAVAPFVPVVLQFAFGGLFSGFLSLYSRSASLAVSWIFVLVLAALLIGNERFRKLYVDLTFQIGVYFFTLFSFLIFFLPVVLRRIDSLIFILSGAVSVVTMLILLIALHRLVPDIVRAHRTRMIQTIAGVYLVFNLLYFTNAIPPLPLALKEAGIYHAVTRVGTQYVLKAEPVPWYKRYLLYNTQFHRVGDESATAFTAIFAPTGLSTSIVHEWQRLSPEGEWVTQSIVEFKITGGRDGGYRGYSIKGALTPGKWRVNVMTKNGRALGRIAFTVVDSAEPVKTIDIIQ